MKLLKLKKHFCPLHLGIMVAIVIMIFILTNPSTSCMQSASTQKAMHIVLDITNAITNFSRIKIGTVLFVSLFMSGCLRGTTGIGMEKSKLQQNLKFCQDFPFFQQIPVVPLACVP